VYPTRLLTRTLAATVRFQKGLDGRTWSPDEAADDSRAARRGIDELTILFKASQSAKALGTTR